ncbi:hypothetical protein HY448_01415 [Candidatus Pacearchaeota archaeon]|nr:hypothetical protein [Candidatus Pacearchaeota archaeon]
MEKMNGSICVFGDSIVWGAYDSEKGGWVNRLRIFLAEKDIEVYNLGISDDDSSDLLKRFKKECEARKPRVIIIAIGTNDSQYVNKEGNFYVQIDEFQKNLDEILFQGKKFTRKIVFVSALKINESKMPMVFEDGKKYFYTNKNLIKYMEKIKELCSKNGIDYIELFNLLDKKDLYDGIHPNSKGHEKIYKKVKDFLVRSDYLK